MIYPYTPSPLRFAAKRRFVTRLLRAGSGLRCMVKFQIGCGRTTWTVRSV